MKRRYLSELKSYRDKYDVDLDSAKHLRNAHLIMKYKNKKLTKKELEHKVAKSHNFSPENSLQTKFPDIGNDLALNQNNAIMKKVNFDKKRYDKM